MGKIYSNVKCQCYRAEMHSAEDGDDEDADDDGCDGHIERHLP